MTFVSDFLFCNFNIGIFLSSSTCAVYKPSLVIAMNSGGNEFLNVREIMFGKHYSEHYIEKWSGTLIVCMESSRCQI